MARRLRDLDLKEVSIVDLPANKRKFLVIKREMNMDNELTLEELEELENEYSDEEENKRDVSKALPDKQIKAINNAINALKPVASELPDECKKAFEMLQAAVSGDGYGYTEPKKEKTEKAGRKLSKTTVERLKSIIEQLSKLIDDTDGNGKPEVKKSTSDVEELSAHIEARIRELLDS